MKAVSPKAEKPAAFQKSAAVAATTDAAKKAEIVAAKLRRRIKGKGKIVEALCCCSCTSSHSLSLLVLLLLFWLLHVPAS